MVTTGVFLFLLLLFLRRALSVVLCAFVFGRDVNLRFDLL